MVKVFLDTNILVDFLLAREGYVQEAIILLQLANAHMIEIMASDLTVANLAYITRRDIPRDEFYRTVKRLRKYVAIVPLGQEVVDAALDAQWKDFEDCLQYFSASRNEATCIVTRNVKDFEDATIPVYTPTEFLQSLSC